MLITRRIAQLHRELADAYEEALSNEAVDDGDVAFAGDAPPDAPDDPWADNSQPQSQPQRQQNRPAGNGGGNQRQASSGGSGTPTQGTFTDDRGKTWTFGKHGAKLCEHGQPAALVTGVSEKTGKSWKAWACPLGYGATWRDKCGLYDFTR